MDPKRKSIIQSNKVGQLLTLDLGGFPQKVLIEGKEENLPVVIVFHGGPGFPLPFNCGSRGMFKDFTDQFIMVYWDQYGCGINWQKELGSLSVAMYVKMAEDLIHQVKKRFPKNRIILFGMAFGTVLTAYAAKELQNEIDGVIAFGQNLNHVLFNNEVFEALEASKISRTKLKEFKELDIRNLTEKQLKDLYMAVYRYTDAFYNRKTKKMNKKPLLRGLLQSPDYRLKDIYHVFHNPLHYHVNLWKELSKLNLIPVLDEVTVPYLIVIGDTDLIVGVNPLREYINNSRKDNLYYFTAMDCGHVPNHLAVDMVCRTLRRLNKELSTKE